MIIDLDPNKKSDRRELAVLHYDLLHNPNTCFHFHLNWIGCTARLIEDLLQGWGRQAERYGMRLVEASVDQQLELSANVFQMPLAIWLAVPPPSADDLAKRGLEWNVDRAGKESFYQEMFLEKLVQYFGFVIDVESDARFPGDVKRVYSYSRTPFPFTQYVHRTGIAFLQLRDTEQSLVWIDNRFITSQSSTLIRGVPFERTSGSGRLKQEDKKSMGGATLPDVGELRREIQKFCGDGMALRSFWEKCIEEMTTNVQDAGDGEVSIVGNNMEILNTS